MTASATNFTGLSAEALADFAASQARVLQVVIDPNRIDEVVENLAILQVHARTFLSSPLAVAPDHTGGE